MNTEEKIIEIDSFLTERGFSQGKDYGFGEHKGEPCFWMNLGRVPIVYRLNDPFFDQLAISSSLPENS